MVVAVAVVFPIVTPRFKRALQIHVRTVLQYSTES
jgi:hypothetical protein